MKNDFAPTAGHRFNLRGEWGGVLDCEVLAIEPHKTLSYTWNHAHSDPAFGLNSVVTFTITPTRIGTHLCAWSKRASAPISARSLAGPCRAGRSFSTISSGLLAARPTPARYFEPECGPTHYGHCRRFSLCNTSIEAPVVHGVSTASPSYLLPSNLTRAVAQRRAVTSPIRSERVLVRF